MGASAAILAPPPPSTSGPGRHPFKVVARVRIPLGALPNEIRPLRGHDDLVRVLVSIRRRYGRRRQSPHRRRMYSALVPGG
jgi:hypothetical protein